MNCRILSWCLGGFPFSEKCRAIDFLRSHSFEICSLICIQLLHFKRKWAEKLDRATFSAEWKSAFRPVFHLANLFARTSKKRMWLAGDDVSVCRQPIKLLFSLFARTNSPSGKPPLLWVCIPGKLKNFLITVRVEPATFGLLVQCSTNWATRSSRFDYVKYRFWRGEFFL